MKKFILLGLTIACTLCMSACSGQMEKKAEEITLEDIIEANRFETMMEEHDSILIKEEEININGSVYHTAYWHFGMDEDGLTADTWIVDEEESMVINARDGVLYGLSGDEMSVRIVPEAEYEDRILEMIPYLPSEDETFVSATAREDDKEIVVETTFETSGTGEPMGATYHLDPQNLQIRRVQIATYDAKGFKTNILAMSLDYGGKEQSNTNAFQAITEPVEGGTCRVTLLIDPGTDHDELRVVKVARGCSVTVSGKKSYELYSDEACRILVPSVNTTEDKATVFAKSVEQDNENVF